VKQRNKETAMEIIVSGATGLVGKALCAALETSGHTLRRLVRNASPLSPQAIYWDPENGVLAPESLEGADAVVHLAGEPVAAGRWTAARKARIRGSRVKGTQLLCERLAACSAPPKALISASAIGYYGSRGDEVLNESSAPGEGFLPDVCRDWEAATGVAGAAGIRVVSLRLGLVLSPTGGALAKMLPPFKLGLGGTLGGGAPWMSWIHIDDLVAAIIHSLTDESLQGPVNAVAPAPVTNKTFTKTLGRVLGRPTVFPVPSPILRIALGEMADALLLASARVTPARLIDGDFAFRFPELEAALRDATGANPKD